MPTDTAAHEQAPERALARTPHPAVVLVEPQLAENIGAAARAMWNCGLDDLRLVRPRAGWPSAKARSAATSAAHVVDRARLFGSTIEAVADLRHVFATTARGREMTKAVVGPEQASEELYAAHLLGERGGFLFGPERTGLSNDDLVLAGRILHIPLNPEFNSLNLAQAVLLVGWEWHKVVNASRQPAAAPAAREPAATVRELLNFFEHLEQELDATGFLRIREKRAAMVRNLRNLFQRARLRSHEVKTLHGIVSSLTGRRKDGSLVVKPEEDAPAEPGREDDF